MNLPRYTYHVLETWADGQTTITCTDLTWNAAHDAAYDAHREGRGFRVECVERSPRGHAMRVVDMTAAMLTEKAFEPVEEPTDELGRRVDEAWANEGGTRHAAE